MRPSQSGFSRPELVALMAAVSALALLATPFISTAGSDSRRALCFNNLRQTGAGLLRWANDRDDGFPWRTRANLGGTVPLSGFRSIYGWTEFITLSNELSSPRVLACPADPAVKLPENWGTGAGGFANSAFRANALSYFLSLHGQIAYPDSVVAGDRDARPSLTVPSSCSPAFANNTLSFSPSDTNIQWTNALHRNAGHLLFADGRVQYVGNNRLYSLLAGPERQNDGGSIHFVPAR